METENLRTITLTLIKKNRKYWACKVKGYDAKLEVNENSENLTPGDHELLVHDISVRTKYGTEIKYTMSEKKTEIESIVTLQHDRYNKYLVKKCQNLGGRWDAENKTWIFSSIVADKVDELDELYNSPAVTVELTARGDEVYAGIDAVHFCGYPIARATGRDSGATLGDGVSMIKGKIKSGGSVKNWATCITGGAVFRLKCSEKLLEKNRETEEKEFDIKIIES
jgi:hypothetical protein